MSSISIPNDDIEAKRDDIMQRINNIYEDYEQKEMQNKNQYHQQRLNRNVLLVGLPKSGKTTLIHALENPQYVSPELSLRSSSEEEPQIEFTVRPASSRLTINILEIPGKMIDETSDLSKINQLCMNRRLFNIHLICFCASFHTGIDESVIRSFTRLIKYLGSEQVSPHLCLIITRCESKDGNQRDTLCDELRQDVDFSNITRYLGRGIHFSGSLHWDDWNQANEALYYQFDNVYNYRKNIFDLLNGDAKTFNMKLEQSEFNSSTTTPIYDDIQQPIEDNEDPWTNNWSLPTTSSIQSSSQPPVQFPISVQQQIHEQFPKSNYSPVDLKKPMSSGPKFTKRIIPTSSKERKYPFSKQRQQYSRYIYTPLPKPPRFSIRCFVILILMLLFGLFVLLCSFPEGGDYFANTFLEIVSKWSGFE